MEEGRLCRDRILVQGLSLAPTPRPPTRSRIVEKRAIGTLLNWNVFLFQGLFSRFNKCLKFPRRYAQWIMKLIWAESVCGGRHLGGIIYCKIYRNDLIIIQHRKRWDVTLRENVILPGHPTRIPIIHHVCWAVVDPGYHTQGCQRKTYYLAKFPRKLHEIERNWN